VICVVNDGVSVSADGVEEAAFERGAASGVAASRAELAAHQAGMQAEHQGVVQELHAELASQCAQAIPFLCISKIEGYINGFMGELTFARRLYKTLRARRIHTCMCFTTHITSIYDQCARAPRGAGGFRSQG